MHGTNNGTNNGLISYEGVLAVCEQHNLCYTGTSMIVKPVTNVIRELPDVIDITDRTVISFVE